jgi:hypothetical protein
MAWARFAACSRSEGLSRAAAGRCAAGTRAACAAAGTRAEATVSAGGAGSSELRNQKTTTVTENAAAREPAATSHGDTLRVAGGGAGVLATASLRGRSLCALFSCSSLRSAFRIVLIPSLPYRLGRTGAGPR